MSEIKSIGIVGTGKAAHFFSGLFLANQIPIKFIAGRNQSKGDALAKKVNSVYYTLTQEWPICDLIILAVKDDVITEIAAMIPESEAIIAHCAGSVNIEALAKFKHTAVVYPLQTLNEFTVPSETPMLLEANSKETEQRLEALVQSAGIDYRFVNSGKRLQYHLAAVFANNFSNAILTATSEVGQMYQLEFDLLKPLIHATFKKVLDGADPKAVQTGPAVRGDQKTMEKHLLMLEQHEELKILYKALSAYLGKKSNQ